MNHSSWQSLFVVLGFLIAPIASEAAMTKLSVAYSTFYDHRLLQQLDGSGFVSGLYK